MPKVGDSKRQPKRLAENLIVGSVIHGPLLDDKKGKYRRCTHVLQRAGLVRFRTVEHQPARVPEGATLDKQHSLRYAADEGGEWFELPAQFVVA